MNIRQDGITPNAARLLWAGFVAILATDVGFGVRGGILANWGAEGTMPLPGLCRELARTPPFILVWAVPMRHSSAPCLALWEGDKPTLHFLKHD